MEDPWSEAQSEAGGSVTNNSRLDFEDKFVEGFDKNTEVSFEKLPDSSDYLRSLESKLSKLTGARHSKEKSSNKDTLVEDLARAREDAIVNFVTSGDISNNSEDIDLERSLEVHPLARRLVPEQAITVGEQVVLTKADQLEKEQERDSESGQ
jgi:hypothetical protein